MSDDGRDLMPDPRSGAEGVFNGRATIACECDCPDPECTDSVVFYATDELRRALNSHDAADFEDIEPEVCEEQTTRLLKERYERIASEEALNLGLSIEQYLKWSAKMRVRCIIVEFVEAFNECGQLGQKLADAIQQALPLSDEDKELIRRQHALVMEKLKLSSSVFTAFMNLENDSSQKDKFQ
jgi:hypothetical protein